MSTMYILSNEGLVYVECKHYFKVSVNYHKNNTVKITTAGLPLHGSWPVTQNLLNAI